MDKPEGQRPAPADPRHATGLDYFDATKPDVHGPVAGRRAVWAIACAAGSVGAGIFVGLTRPRGPMQDLSAGALAAMGVLSCVLGAWAWRQPRRSYIDGSLAAISIALGVLCVAAAMRIAST